MEWLARWKYSSSVGCLSWGGCRSRKHSFFMSGQGQSDDGFFLSPAWFWRAVQVRICAFPASSLGLSNVSISPDVRAEEGWSMRQVGRE